MSNCPKKIHISNCLASFCATPSHVLRPHDYGKWHNEMKFDMCQLDRVSTDLLMHFLITSNP